MTSPSAAEHKLMTAEQNESPAKLELIARGLVAALGRDEIESAAFSPEQTMQRLKEARALQQFANRHFELCAEEHLALGRETQLTEAGS